ncbi:hypothetical protein ACLB9X_23780 [Streptomyces sp. 5K101]|uniref:hypothetical protein n=1 Tax=Streptomyces sp. 5K101 TaxID=3390037 RepID=UPI003975B29F
MLNSALRRIPGAALTVVLAASTLAATAPSAVAAPTADTPRLQVLTYNAFLVARAMHDEVFHPCDREPPERAGAVVTGGAR